MGFHTFNHALAMHSTVPPATQFTQQHTDKVTAGGASEHRAQSMLLVVSHHVLIPLACPLMLVYCQAVAVCVGHPAGVEAPVNACRACLKVEQLRQVSILILPCTEGAAVLQAPECAGCTVQKQ